ncbi:MAG: alpha/beta hydrolase [Proteobacteria bacterium]|nr:alpha/beta hydrolase [Pseudomonadota bacterium]
MAEVVRDNVKIHYDTFGKKKDDGECILFLSGASSDGNVWRNQVDYLSKEYFAITVDNRGSGKSDCPDYNYDADMLTSDIEAVLAKEEIKETNLVGFSMGGLIAQRFLNNNPKRVKRLVLMNCTLGSGNPDTILPQREVINMFLFSAALTLEDCCKNAMDYHFGESFEEKNPDLYKEYFDETMKSSPGIRHQIPIMVSDKPLIEDYSAIKVPVLYILSTDDPVTPYQNGESLKKHLPQARVEYLDGYHASMLIHPEKVNALIKDFFFDS